MGHAKKGVVDEYAEQLMLNTGRSWELGHPSTWNLLSVSRMMSVCKSCQGQASRGQDQNSKACSLQTVYSEQQARATSKISLGLHFEFYTPLCVECYT
jgi:hypothetical protein